MTYNPNNFKTHDMDEDQRLAVQIIRGQFDNLAQIINARCPKSRELSIAMTNLEDSLMWAVAAIARNGKKSP